MNVLGIETSCDETAAAVVGGNPEKPVLADKIYSQEVHAAFGGVVPELAARAHTEKLVTLVRAALRHASLEKPDAVAATAGPGLIGAVLVGFSFAKALAATWNVPFVGVNHLEGHLLSSRLEHPSLTFPYLCMLASGGHTAIYLCRGLGDYETLGETRDDAAGEAFDKVARMLDLGYPGGPLIDRLASSADPTTVTFPRPLPGEMDFSFSGLKTAVRTHLRGSNRALDAEVAAGFQAAVVDCLLQRIRDAVGRTGVRRVAISGGVAANAELRSRLQGLPGLETFIPARARCTDNAAMIAYAGRLRVVAGLTHDLAFAVQPAWRV